MDEQHHVSRKPPRKGQAQETWRQRAGSSNMGNPAKLVTIITRLSEKESAHIQPRL